MYIALMQGVGEGCDYTIGCNKTWKLLHASNKEDAEKEIVELFEYYGGEERVNEIELIGFDPSNSEVFNAKGISFIKPKEKVRGCKHPESDGNFCSECGKPMWVEK